MPSDSPSGNTLLKQKVQEGQAIQLAIEPDQAWAGSMLAADLLTQLYAEAGYAQLAVIPFAQADTASPPDLILFGHGSGVFPAQMHAEAADLKEKVTDLQAAYPQSGLGLISAITGDPHEPEWLDIKTLIDAQAAYANKLGLMFVHVWQEIYWRKIAGETWANYTRSKKDYVLADEGHRLVAECIMDELHRQVGLPAPAGW